MKRLNTRALIIFVLKIKASALIVLFFCQSSFSQSRSPSSLLTDSIFHAIAPIHLRLDSSALNTVYREEKSPIMPANHLKPDWRPSTDGNWYHYNVDYRSWFIKVHVEQAKAIGLVISDIRFKKGEKLYVSNGKIVKGPFEQNDIPPSGVIPIDHLPGNELAIGFYTPYTNAYHGDFLIETLSVLTTTDSSSRKSEKANSCYPCLTGNYWTKMKRSVVKIVTFRENESVMCTGVLINNTLSDAKPYILTANHCLSDQDDVERAVFTFNYDDPDCDEILTSEYGSLFGARLLATSYEHDFSLIALDQPVPISFQPYFSGWDLSEQTGNQISCIHHPHGGVKQISVQNHPARVSSYDVDNAEPRSENAFWHIQAWDIGATEAGSSGAPLFNGSRRIVGTLSGGSARCGSPYNDYFQQISKSWSAEASPSKQLKYWLDPTSSGVTMLDGFDPLEGFDLECDTVSNRVPAEVTGIVGFEDGGYFSGCNKRDISSFAEKFLNPDSSSLMGITFSVGRIDHNAAGGITLSVHTSENGVPGESVFQKYIPYTALKWYSNYVDIYPGVAVPPEFFISYSPDCSASIDFAIDQTEWRESETNTAWIKHSSVWQPMNVLHKNYYGSSLSIDAILCNVKSNDTAFEGRLEINLRPNPVSSQLIGFVSGYKSTRYSVRVCDLQGQQKDIQISIYDDHFVIDVSSFSPGVYVVILSADGRASFKRFIKM